MPHPDDKKSKKRLKVRKRLSGIQTFEMAGVGFGANRRHFAVLKEASMFNLDKLSQAHQAISKVINVLKAGQPSAQTLEALQGNLASAQAVLAGLVSKNGKLVDPSEILSKIEDLKGTAKSLSEISQDLRVQDFVDKIEEQTEDLASSFQMPKVSADGDTDEVADEVADEGDLTVASEPAIADPPAEPVEPAGPAVTAPVEPVAAAEPAEPAPLVADPEPAVPVLDASQPAAAGEPSAPAAAPAAPVQEVVTKADLTELAKAFKEGLSTAIKGLREEMTTVLKSQSGYSLLPSNSMREELGQATEGDEKDDADWNGLGFAFDLNQCEDELD